MPPFYDDESRASDSGNRCKLRLRHTLLMALVRKKDNPTQGTLQALFGVDQTGVCRYLDVMDRILAVVLPTAKSISKEITACKTVEELNSAVPCISGSSHTNVEKYEIVEELNSAVPCISGSSHTNVEKYEIVEELNSAVPCISGSSHTNVEKYEIVEELNSVVPWPDVGDVFVGDVFVDGTHCRVQRPSEKTARRTRYSGKKKTFTNNTSVYANADGVIIGISKSSAGSTGDITLLREDPIPFGRWAESMRDEATPKEDKIRIWADKGCHGVGKDLPGATLMIPYKRSKKHRILTAEQKAHNHLVNSTKVPGEHSRKDQALRAPDRPVRWHHRSVRP